MPAAEAVRAARALEGEVVELRHFRVWRRFSSGRHCLVAPDVVEPGALASEGPGRHLGPGQGPAAEPAAAAVAPAAANPTWRLVSRDDPLAAEIASRCPSSRVVARAASAREAFEARTNRDADFVRFPASVAWARLPDPPGKRFFKFSADARPLDVLRARRRVASRERHGRSSSRTRAVIPPEELAARMLALGCLACGRELDPDPDGDGIARQCACHDGSRNLVGRIWRPLEIGLANPTGTVPVPVSGGFEEETEAPGGGGDGDDRRGDAIGGGGRRLAAATPARVRDSALVAKILMGVDPAEAARCAARRRRRGGIDDAPRAGVLFDDDARGPGEGRRESSGAGSGDDEGRPFFPLRDASARADRDARDDAPDDALAVAARGLNALCSGAESNAPFEWVARTRAVDANGVAWTGGGAALEIVGFDVEIGRRDESAS
jgi:hypothetical protein